MSKRWLGVLVVSGVLVLGGCGSSGDDDADADAASTSTEAPTTEAPATTEAPTTTEAPSSTEVSPTTGDVGAAVDCQEVLASYAAAFDAEDLTEVIALFRSLVPSMPDDVAAATTRLADAYEDADANLTNLNMANQDLSADAEAFSDWTNDGCPTG